MGLESNKEVIKDTKNVTKTCCSSSTRRITDGSRKRSRCSEMVSAMAKKRHHDIPRFFPSDTNMYRRNTNALAGTVVDQGINHFTEGTST